MRPSKYQSSDIESIFDMWHNKLKTPKPREFNFQPLKGRNILLVKNEDNRIGLVIIGTKKIDSSFKLKNFSFEYFKVLKSKALGKDYERCQMILADRTVNPDYLINILFGIFKIEHKENITSKDLFDIMTKVKDMFDPEASVRNEVIGVWGELNFLNFIIGMSNDKVSKERMLSSWESKGGRKKIDFRFVHAKIAVEVKTTTSEKRIHHFSGHDQFLKPSGFDSLLFYSLRITEDHAGSTCSDILEQIKSKLADTELIDTLEEILVIRGWSISNNNHYRFTSRDGKSIFLFDSSSYKLPGQPKGVSNMEWEHNLEVEDPIASKKLKIILNSITN
jgi:hypothetical protein